MDFAVRFGLAYAVLMCSIVLDHAVKGIPNHMIIGVFVMALLFLIFAYRRPHA